MRLLACLALLTLAAPVFAQTTTWGVQTETDPMTDEAHAVVMSSGGDRDIRLMVMCNQGQKVAMLLHPYLGGDSEDRVRFSYRVDSNLAIGPAEAYLTSDHRASVPFMARSGDRAMFAAMMEGRRLLLRLIDPLDNETVTSSLSLDGFADAFNRLTCPLPLRR